MAAKPKPPSHMLERITVRFPSDKLAAFNAKLEHDLAITQATFFRHVIEAFLEDRLTINTEKDKLYVRK